jgi:hypothetical protein
MIMAPCAVWAEIVGNPLLPRPITDTANGSIFILDDPFTARGVVTDWSIYDAEAPTSLEITPLIVEPVGNGWQVTGIGATQIVTEFGVQEHEFDLVSGSSQVGPGSYFAWKDGGQGTNNTGVPEWFDGLPGTVDSLGTVTSFGIGEVLDTERSLNRTYSIQADAVAGGGGGPSETVCNPVIDAPSLDDDAGTVFVLTSAPFTVNGDVTEWRFFHGQTDRRITPLILEKVADDYVIRGIGATRNSNGMGAQNFEFELVSGSDAVGPNFVFGWKDGGNGVSNTGVAEWNDVTNDSVIWFGGGHGTFYVGDVLGPGVAPLSRTYSISANAVPEPSSVALAGGAVIAVWLLRRHRRSSEHAS